MEELFVPEGSSLTLTPVEGGVLIRYLKTVPPVYGNSRVVIVSGVASATKKRDIQDIFGRYGRIRNIIPHKDGGRSFKYEIIYEDPRDALDAVAAMNGREVDGSPIYVQFDD